MLATPAHAASLDGAAMSWPWALPFAGLLLTIAAGPTLFAALWHAHYGKIAALWAALALAPIAIVYGLVAAAESLTHALLGEFLSFIVVLFALYTVAGGIVVSGSLRGTPLVNTAILAFGAGIASIVGTTGAAMILIRPMIRANAGAPPPRARDRVLHHPGRQCGRRADAARRSAAVRRLPARGRLLLDRAASVAADAHRCAASVLALFLLVDLVPARDSPKPRCIQSAEPIRIRGAINLVLIAAIIGAILLSALWKPGIALRRARHQARTAEPRARRCADRASRCCRCG